MKPQHLTVALVAVASLAQPLSVRAAELARQVEYLDSGKVFPRDLPASALVRHGDTLYLSGQIGLRPGTATLVPGGIPAEARQAMENIRTELQVHGYSLANLVKCTVVLADIADRATFDDVYKTFFSSPYPAYSLFAVSGLALGASVQVDCIGAVGERCCSAKPGRN